MTGYRTISIINICRNFVYGQILYTALFLLIFSYNSSAQTVTDRYRIVEWSHKDGLSIPYKNHVIQDTNGFLWITSPLGINRFDGGNFTVFNPENSGNSSYSFTIVEDSLKNLWVGTNKGILYCNTLADTFRNIFPDIGAYASISTIIPFSAGKNEVYCIESSTRIVSYDIRTFKRKLISTLPQSWTDVNKLMIQFAVYDPGTNSVWMNRGDHVADSTGLIRIEVSTGITEVISWPCLTGKKHADYNGALCLDRKRNRIWINNSDGLLSMDLATKKIHTSPYFLKLSNDGYENAIGINLDNNGNVWVASNSHGILIYDPETDACQPLFSDSAQQKQSGQLNFSIYFDKNDMVWLGYYNKKNIRQLIPYTPAVNTFPYTTFGSPAYHLFPGRNGNIILSTSNGILEWNPVKNISANADKIYSSFFMMLDTINEKYWSLKPDNSGIIETDLRSGKKNKITWPEGNGNPGSSIIFNLIYGAQDGMIFMADHQGVYQVRTGDSVAKKIIPIDFHATNFVLANDDYIFIRLHFSSRNLCYRRNGKNWELFLNPIDKINWSCVLFDPVTSSYWVGALQELYHFDHEFNLIKKYTKADGVEELDVLSLMTDAKNNIWFNNSSGQIWKLETGTGVITKINEKDGYSIQEYDWQTPHLRGTDGALFYMGHNGITVVHPDKIKDFILPRIYISKILVNHQPWDKKQSVLNTGEMILDYNQRSLTFQAGLIDYNTYKDSRIRYRMSGLNQDWQLIMPGDDIHYFELATGQYSLELQASGSGNNFSGPVRRISITIRPAFWQQTSFWLPVSIIIFCILYLLIRKRINEKYKAQIENSRREMQLAEMKQKTTELEQKALDMEMKTLRAQMNPHFIFNSLNSINRFILQNNKTSASSYLTKFSRLIRMILQHSQEQLISLESELESLDLYLELESVRFDNKFAYKVSVQGAVDPSMIRIPPMIIQPYAENAIWHGLMLKETRGQLDIEISSENGHIFICIKDDGVGRENAARLESKSTIKYKSMGMKITQERILNLVTDSKHDAYVHINDLVNNDGSAAGTEVTIKIPTIYD